MDEPRIMNLNELPEAKGRDRNERFGSRHVAIGAPLGAKKLGYNVTEIAPGKRAFPYHFHYVNEELFLVVEGTGELRYLAPSTTEDPEIVEYPDSGKYGAWAGRTPGAREARFGVFAFKKDAVDYWEGE